MLPVCQGGNDVYRAVKVVIAGCLYYSGLVPLARRWTRRSRRRLIILNYHRADGHLRRHFLYLRRHYRLLQLEVALEELYAPVADRPSQPDRRTPLAITFDDGYCDNYTCASELARELQVPIAVFLPTGYIDSGERFVWMEGEYLARHAQVNTVTIEGRTYYLDRRAQRRALRQAIDTRLRHASSVADRMALLTLNRRTLGVSADASPDELPALPLSWADVREMGASGWVTFGAHTVHHPILSCLVDPGEVRYEVTESRRVLKQRLGHPVRSFAYPYGGLRDIGGPALQAVHEAGYSWALTTIPGVNTPRTDPYLLRRMHADTTDHWWVLAAEATGIWQSLLSLLLQILGVPTDTGAVPLDVSLAATIRRAKALLPFIFARFQPRHKAS
jgi:peptidoglycan/xylan/chitin deacetylase (PgdA/CDA1 family)